MRPRPTNKDRNAWRRAAGYDAGIKGQKFSGGHPDFMSAYKIGHEKWQEREMLDLLLGKKNGT